MTEKVSTFVSLPPLSDHRYSLWSHWSIFYLSRLDEKQNIHRGHSQATICITISMLYISMSQYIYLIYLYIYSIYLLYVCLCVTDVSVCIEHWCLARGVQSYTCSSPVMLWHNVLQYQKVPSCNRMPVKWQFPLANPGLRNKNNTFLVYLCFVHAY